MKEVWRPIPNHPDYYVSNLGGFHPPYRFHPFIKAVKPHTGKSVSKRVDGQYYTLAQLVAMTFVPKAGAECTKVWHKDKNPNNNAANNLVWVSPKIMNVLMQKTLYKKRSVVVKYTATNTFETFPSTTSAAKALGLSPSTITMLRQNKRHNPNYEIYDAHQYTKNGY